MSTKENKALVRHIYDLIMQGKVASTYELYAPESVFHGLSGDMYVEQVKGADAIFFAAFPDAVYVFEDMIAEGDKVAFRVTMTATHKGEFMGIAPTEKKIKLGITNIVRIVGGKVIEFWGSPDMLGLMQQIGAIPK
jgi:predicted ester cyclase